MLFAIKMLCYIPSNIMQRVKSFGSNSKITFQSHLNIQFHDINDQIESSIKSRMKLPIMSRKY